MRKYTLLIGQVQIQCFPFEKGGGVLPPLDLYFYPYRYGYQAIAQSGLHLPLPMLQAAGYTKFKLASAANISYTVVDYPSTPAYGYGSTGVEVGIEYTLDYSNPNNYFRFFAMAGDLYSNGHLVIY